MSGWEWLLAILAGVALPAAVALALLLAGELGWWLGGRDARPRNRHGSRRRRWL